MALVVLVVAGCGSEGRPEYSQDAYVAAMAAEVPDEPGMQCLAPTVVEAFGAERLSLAGVTPEAFATAESLGGLVVEPAPGSVEKVAAQMEECFDLEAELNAELPKELASLTCIFDQLDVERFAEETAELMLLARFEAELDMGYAAMLFGDATPACVEQALLTRAIQTGQVNEEQARCLGDHMDDATTKAYFVEIMANGTPDERDALDLVAAVLACGMPMDTTLGGAEEAS